MLNFVAHHRLPYKKMLTITGVMLTVVLFVMVGEEVFEMQQAGWLGTSEISWLQWLPSWAGTWLSIFPNWETVIAQGLSVVLVLGVLCSRSLSGSIAAQKGRPRSIPAT